MRPPFKSDREEDDVMVWAVGRDYPVLSLDAVRTRIRQRLGLEVHGDELITSTLALLREMFYAMLDEDTERGVAALMLKGFSRTAAYSLIREKVEEHEKVLKTAQRVARMRTLIREKVEEHEKERRKRETVELLAVYRAEAP